MIVHKVDQFIGGFSSYSGLDEGQCRLLTCVFLSFPFSAIFKRIPDKYYKIKNYYIIFISAFYIAVVLKLYTGVQVLFFNALFTYILTKYLNSKLMPWINLVFLMLFLCINHLHAQFFVDFDPTVVDITGAQMVLVMKLSSFAWSYRDGQLYHKDVARFNSELNTFQKSRAILKHPSFLSFMGYVFFYATIVTGPSFDYADYERFILTDMFVDVPESKKPGRRRKRMIPKSGRVALLKVLMGLGWAGLLIYSQTKITQSYVISNDFLTDNSFIFRIFYLWAFGFTLRLKYYSVWTISEAGCIVAGIGYNGYDAKKDKFYWNRVQNIDIYAFETGQNVHTCLEAWNMNTNKWLKNFVYLRTARRTKEGKLKTSFFSTLITFATSAFWHGTMPGYYMTFIVGAFMQDAGKIFRRQIRPIFATKSNKVVSKYKIFYDIVSYFVTQLAFGFVVAPFSILELKSSLFVWRSVYFYVPVGCFITIFTFNGPYGKAVSKFLQQYYLQEPVEEPPKSDVTLTSAPTSRLQDLRSEFNSASDLLSSLKEIPVFDDQKELQETLESLDAMDSNNLKDNFHKIEKEYKEWISENGGKDNSSIDEKEVQAIRDALTSLQADIKYYLDQVTPAALAEHAAAAAEKKED